MAKDNEEKRREIPLKPGKKTSSGDDGAMGEPQQFVGFDVVEAPPAAAEPEQPKKENPRKDIDVIVERLAWAKRREQGREESVELDR